MQGKPPRLDPVELGISSLHSRGCFIFERPGHLAVWTGMCVPERMQSKLRKVMKGVGDARGGNPQVITVQPLRAQNPMLVEMGSQDARRKLEDLGNLK